jgi:cytochrome c-type biogenesis protein CcmH/NrfF
MNGDLKTETMGAAIKAAPPVSISTATLCGVPINTVVMYATLVYTVLMGAHLIYKWWTEISDRRKERKQ